MLRHLRFALRQLRHSPGFAITAVLTLALGIGATTAVFSVLDAVLLEPLPFAQPDRIVAIVSVPYGYASFPTTQDWQQRSHSFESIAAYRGWSPTVRTALGPGGKVLEISQSFFSTLGASFALGQDLPRTGYEGDCTGQAVVSGGLWKQLGGGTQLANRTLEIDHRTFQITGVLPVAQTIEGSYALNHPDIFVPLGCDPQAHVTSRGDNDFSVLGRLRPGVSLSAATADLARADATLRHDFPQYYSGIIRQPPIVRSWITQLTGTDARPALLATLCACGLMLLIACANLANLLLARNMQRRAEFATRATLGATLGQLVQQLLAESAVLALAGAAAGVALGFGALQLLLRARALDLPRLAHASISLPVLAFVICVAAMVTILLTLLPAVRTLQPGLLRDLSLSGRASASGRSRRSVRLLVAAQIAFSFVLVACSGWMIAGVYTLLHQPLGFQPDHLLMVGIDIEHSSVLPRYNAAQTTLYFNQLVATLRQLPGVTAVAATKNPPLSGAINKYDFCSDADPDQCQKPATINPDSYDITTGYFATVGQPLLEGRDFTDADSTGQHVVIVNRLLADREWRGKSAIGHRIKTGQLQDWATVVGVVGNVRSYALDAPPGPDLYLPDAYQPPTHMVVLLRTAGDPSLPAKTVRDVILGQHADLSLYHLRTMDQEMSNEVALRRFAMQLAAAFGMLALFLAILGTYGMLAYEVSFREKEIGIRLALGSSRNAIVRLLLGQESRWVLLGAIAGLAGAAASGYLLRAQFYQPRTAAVPVLAATALLLVIPSLMAIALPARRAAQLDPVEALRRE